MGVLGPDLRVLPADYKMRVAREYGCLVGVTFRTNYLINPKGVLQVTMSDLLVGLSADEALRLAQLSQPTHD